LKSLEIRAIVGSDKSFHVETIFSSLLLTEDGDPSEFINEIVSWEVFPFWDEFGDKFGGIIINARNTRNKKID